MKVNEFLSAETYVLLPTRSNPKVYLTIDTKEKAKLAFSLYNPFSRKGKILKWIMAFACVHCNSWSKWILPTWQGANSPFLIFLEEKLKTKLSSSAYIATAKDKIVLQLQNDRGIVGYLKYPISRLGEKRLLKEQKAIFILAKKNIVPTPVLFEKFGKTPFIVLKNIQGKIDNASPFEYNKLLTSFQKGETSKLTDHPRIINLKNRLKKLHLVEVNSLLGDIISLSEKSYQEVFEHGDFAPWNLIKTKNGLVPFDFEYSEESGLEHLDELKYHFQREHLLFNKTGSTLISAIARKTDIEEFNLIFQIFLIKEIINKAESDEAFTFESILLKKMSLTGKKY